MQPYETDDTDTIETVDVAVIGGGLAGLAAATLLGRAGRTVALFEKAGKVGGDAVTQMRDGYTFNLGPHALYRHGAGIRVLRELGVPFSGKQPLNPPSLLYQESLRSFWRSGLLGPADMLEIPRVFMALSTVKLETIQGISFQAWLEREVRSARVRALLAMITRLVTYANATEIQSADSVVAQLRIALWNVYYLDNGWQTLVDGLRDAATRAGVRIYTGVHVAAIEHDDAVRGVRLANGPRYGARAVIMAVDPKTASALVDGGTEQMLSHWAAEALSIEAACLDVGLRMLAHSGDTYVLGIDRPLYLSVHSRSARLAPEGGALIHVARYLRPGERPDPTTSRRELEKLLDQAQPGWREHVVTERFMPHLRVSNAIVTASAGGMAGRPGCEVPSIRNLYIAGDWVGPQGLLSDASLASAKQAVQRILVQPAEQQASGNGRAETENTAHMETLAGKR
ncbi:MAG TPA: FAD-dependent oxidoreductase [Ktedonobacterales bacterium]